MKQEKTTDIFIRITNLHIKGKQHTKLFMIKITL